MKGFHEVEPLHGISKKTENSFDHRGVGRKSSEVRTISKNVCVKPYGNSNQALQCTSLSD